jgi:hypothetical protein
MNTNDLNKYIKNYIENDKTNRAIMLTGAWGVGKSFYIKDTLIPFLESKDGGNHKSIVVSLYGLEDISEISKAVYLGAQFDKLSEASEDHSLAAFGVKTIIKGLISHIGVDSDVMERDLQKLYESVDLTGKLLIFEDIERSEIGILKILGYVNSLVDQDGVKVLLVANEDEIISFDCVEENEPLESGDYGFVWDENQVKKYTEDTIKYKRIKEKAVGDTIVFTADLKSAIVGIIQIFVNTPKLLELADDECLETVLEIMSKEGSSNLRAILFACQKTSDIFERIGNSVDTTREFEKAIFYGIVSLSLRLNRDSQFRFTGGEKQAIEQAETGYPCFRFCYDYIMEQDFDIENVKAAKEAFEDYRLYIADGNSSDSDLKVLYNYHLYTEAEVAQALSNITKRLRNADSIPFSAYGGIANRLVATKHNLGLEIEEAKNLLIENVKGRGNKLDEGILFWLFDGEFESNASKEFSELKTKMVNALSEGVELIPGFKYLPEQADFFKESVMDKRGTFYAKNGFLKYLDITRLADMFFNSSPSQMQEVREAFNHVYGVGNANDFFKDDLPELETMRESIEQGKGERCLDKVQLLHCEWFISNLSNYMEKLYRECEV